MTHSNRQQITLQLKSNDYAAWQRIIQEDKASPIPSGSIVSIFEYLISSAPKKLFTNVPAVNKAETQKNIRTLQGDILELRKEIKEKKAEIYSLKASLQDDSQQLKYPVNISLGKRGLGGWLDLLEQYPGRSQSEIFAALIAKF